MTDEDRRIFDQWQRARERGLPPELRLVEADEPSPLSERSKDLEHQGDFK